MLLLVISNSLIIQFGQETQTATRQSTTYCFPIAHQNKPTLVMSILYRLNYETAYNSVYEVTATSWTQTWTIPCFWVSVGS